MRVYGLDGQQHSWQLSGHLPRGGEGRSPSQAHLRARALLECLYPSEPRLEEVFLPGSGGLFADFVLPGRRLVVEVQGEQHYQYIFHFHKHRLGFVNSCLRDSLKARWCELNGLALVELPHDECEHDWARRLRDAESRGEARTAQ